jgi:uncharacterized protein YodC (DUF2158 family)
MALAPRKGRLIRVAAAEEFCNPNEPPLRIGDIVRLNSGGPNSVVVDFSASDGVVVSWRDTKEGVQEETFPRACLHRTRLGG